MKDLEIISSHIFINPQPKTFLSKNDTVSAKFTGKNWGTKDQNLKKRKKRIKL